MTEYAGPMLSRPQVGKDGEIAIERAKGRSSKRPMPEFGENVHYKPMKSVGKQNKFDAMWRDRIWFGINGRLDEAFIGTIERVIKARAIKRQPDDEKFIFDELDKVKGLRWTPVPGKEGYGVPKRIEIKLFGHEKDAKEFESDVIIKRMRITRGSVEEFGMMEGCLGYRAVRLGRVSQGHSEKCRSRIEKKLMETE